MGSLTFFTRRRGLNSHIERTRQQQRKYALSAAIGMERSMKVQRISVLIAMLLLAAALVVASATRARGIPPKLWATTSTANWALATTPTVTRQWR